MSSPSAAWPNAATIQNVKLVAEELRLNGRVDLLSVEANGTTITDFKTGAEDPTHHDQLRIYAVLWTEDRDVNLDGMAVAALVAAYPSHDMPVVVPDAAELADLRAEVVGRIAAADLAVDVDETAAFVGEQCELCNVRGLCDVYWATGAPNTADVADGAGYDLKGPLCASTASRVGCSARPGRAGKYWCARLTRRTRCRSATKSRSGDPANDRSR